MARRHALIRFPFPRASASDSQGSAECIGWTARSPQLQLGHRGKKINAWCHHHQWHLRGQYPRSILSAARDDCLRKKKKKKAPFAVGTSRPANPCRAAIRPFPTRSNYIRIFIRHARYLHAHTDAGLQTRMHARNIAERFDRNCSYALQHDYAQMANQQARNQMAREIRSDAIELKTSSSRDNAAHASGTIG